MTTFQYQIKTQPIFVPAAAAATDIKWYAALSEPVRVKPGLLASIQHYFESPPAIIVSFGWMANLSDPVRIPLRLTTGSQRFDYPNPFPVIDISWFNSLSNPQKLSPPLLPTPAQPFFHFDPIPVVSFGWWEPLAERPWIDLRKGLSAYQQEYQINVNPIPDLPLFNWSYEPLSEPVRFKPILRPEVQPSVFPSLNPIITFTCVLNAIETKDAFTLVLYQYAEALNANVSIKEIVNSFAMAGIVEKNQQSAMVSIGETGIVSPVSISTPQTIFANVGIIEVKP